ncbi:MAG: sulfite exporter TauE/SafE family protein [Clostridia bacterium]|nr:sulfite exporter TauE/SafE family protein [Clostridia bacterium]
MIFYLYVLIGVIGGIPGGMGMGGGTVLIPLLRLVGVEQHAAQGINLLSFLPLALVSLISYEKRGLLKKKRATFYAVPALLFSVIGSLIASFLDGVKLKRLFGAFLMILAVIQFTKRKKSDKIES